MDNNKYYTPSIEDIRIGYECEILNGYGNWHTINITLGHIFNDLLFHTRDISKELSGIFRTPYLTKEDIESEGWTHKWHEKRVHSWEKEDFVLSAFDDILRIKISYKSGYQLFDGNCLSINELRTISKLIGV